MTKVFEKITLYVASDDGFLEDLIDLLHEAMMRNKIEVSLIDWDSEEYTLKGGGEGERSEYRLFS